MPSRAGFADSAAHTLCKRPPAAAPGRCLLSLHRSVCLSGDHDGRRWPFGRQQMGQGSSRHLPQGSSSIAAPPAPAQGQCRLLSSCNPSARPKLNPPGCSRCYRKRHPLQHNAAAMRPGKLFIIISLQQRYGKKHPPSPGANSSSCSFHVRIYVHHSVKSIREKNSIQVLKKLSMYDLKPGTRKKVVEKISWATPSYYKIYTYIYF